MEVLSQVGEHNLDAANRDQRADALRHGHPVVTIRRLHVVKQARDLPIEASINV